MAAKSVISNEAIGPPRPGRRGERRPFVVAPMMERTDRHFRWLIRRITRQALLTTEMVPVDAALYGDPERILGFDAVERPLALQLGGSDPQALARAARIAASLGYDEIDLNVGCPSGRVRAGRFGACLMAEPERVARAVGAMRDAVDLPVTVKHRIGIDELDTEEDLARFVATVARAGCDRFTVHARKAWLDGLSPKQNRSVPPLRYDVVWRLKERFPDLVIGINGGITSLAEVRAHLERVDAVMVGRAVYDDPLRWVDTDAELFGRPAPRPDLERLVRDYAGYAERALARGARLPALARHLLPLARGRPGARAWRRILTDGATRPGAGPELFEEALAALAAPAGPTGR